MKRILLFLLSFFSLTQISFSKAPCDIWWGGASYQIKMPWYGYNFITDDMPDDIKNAYLAFYDIQTHSSYVKFQAFLNSQKTLTDTVKHLISNLYRITDYNCLLRHKFNCLKYRDSSIIYSGSLVERDIRIFFHKLTQTQSLDDALINSEFILQLNIDKIEYQPQKGDYIISATILDTFKGKIIANTKRIIFADSLPKNDTLPESIKAEIGTAIIFEYKTDSMNIKDLLNKQCFAFIHESPICIDTTNDLEYFYVYNEEYIVDGYKQKIFPIENNFVIDDNNCIGFGYKVPVDEWESKLTNRIDEIKSWIYPANTVNFHSEDFQTSVCPNPSYDGAISVNFAKSDDLMSFELCNALGVIVQKEDLSCPSSLSSYLIQNLQPGVYFLKINHKTQSEVLKFVVIN